MSDLPLMKTPDDLSPNTYPVVGAAVLLNYGHTPHIAIVTGFTEDGVKIAETNYRRCKKTERTLRFTDAALRGFYLP